MLFTLNEIAQKPSTAKALAEVDNGQCLSLHSVDELATAIDSIEVGSLIHWQSRG